MSTAASELLIERDGALAIVTLNRPERMNALSSGLLRALASEIPRLTDAPDVRAIMLTGAGKAFCAGGDVDSMSSPSNEQASLAGMQSFHGWLKALWTTDKLVITAVNGAAAGGGFGIALLGDLVVASEAAYFKCAFTSLGVAADFALGFTLPRIVGANRAADILYGDQRMTAQTALSIGMVNRVFPTATFAEDAVAFARTMAATSRGAQLSKRLLRFEQADAFARYLELEARTQTEAFQSEDFREGVAAFRERRPPRFRGH
jgi:2-(1,2-epoxy-1,2-dihydrophenyl)acetyl-CoA isomerase